MQFRHSFAVVMLSVSLLVAGCSGSSTGLYFGTVEAVETRLSAEVSGVVSDVLVVEGEQVTEGQELVLLDSSTQTEALRAAEAALRSAQADLEMAKIEAEMSQFRIQAAQAKVAEATARVNVARREYDRNLDLHNKGVVSEIELYAAEQELRAAETVLQGAIAQLRIQEKDTGEARVAAAEARVKEAERNLAAAQLALNQRTIKAPVGGIVDHVLVRKGEYLAPGQLAVVLRSTESMEIHFYVPATHVGQLSLGGTVRVTPVGSSDVIEATVSYIAQEATFAPPTAQNIKDRENQVFLVKARVPGKVEQLKSGISVQVDWGAQ